MPFALQCVAHVLNLDNESKARVYCNHIQRRFVEPPSWDAIANVIQKLGRLAHNRRLIIQGLIDQGHESVYGEILEKYQIVPLCPLYDEPDQLGLLERSTLIEAKKAHIKGRIIGITGSKPYRRADLVALVQNIDGIFDNKTLWEPHQIIVIGENSFDKSYLQRSIEVSRQINAPFRYMTQEDFCTLLTKNTPPCYDEDSPIVRQHAGMAFLASQGFTWPSTKAKPSDTICEKHIAETWRENHELTHTYGYRVGVKGQLSAEERQARLRQAIQDLGLQKVAEHIAWCVRNAKCRHDDTMHRSIDTWETDLDWLYCQFYLRSHHSFSWPSGRRRA